MRLSIVLVVAILLIGGVFVELKVRQDHSHSLAAGQHGTSITSTTQTAKNPPGLPQLTNEAHDACRDIPLARVAAALGATESARTLSHSIAAVDPGWQAAPAYAGCIWTYFHADQVKKMDVVELLVASFSSTADATKFYREQTSGYHGVTPASLSRVKVGTEALFVPQPPGHYGGALTVLSGNTTVRVDSLVRSKVMTKKHAVTELEQLAASAIHHVTAP